MVYSCQLRWLLPTGCVVCSQPPIALCCSEPLVFSNLSHSWEIGVASHLHPMHKAATSILQHSPLMCQRNAHAYTTKFKVVRNLVCLARGCVFVNLFASISSVGFYSSAITSPSTFSRKKWNLMSMCFVLAWYIGFLSSAMHPWLSW